MTLEISKAPWYSKVYDYLRNRNRVEPAQSNLPDCDFFTLGPRRTLRILKSIHKSSEFCDLVTHKLESDDKNFIPKWTEESHLSDNCRCSFYKSYGSHSINEQRSPEFNQARISFKEDKVEEETVCKLKIDASKNLNNFVESVTPKTNTKIIEKVTLRNYFKNHLSSETTTVKYKIIKDLEIYIDIILGNVFDNTINIIKTYDKTFDNKKLFKNKKSSGVKPNKPIINDESANNSLDIKFNFFNDNCNNGNCYKSLNPSELNGYVNQSFIPCIDDPDKLDFYLIEPISEKNFDMIDCLDSGINSVETMEISIESDFSVENSLTHMKVDKLDQMIVSPNLDGEYRTDYTAQLQKITSDCIDNVSEAIGNSIIINKETVEFKTNLFDSIDDNLYSDLTSLVTNNIIDEKKPISNIDYCLKVSLQKNDQVEKLNSEVTWNKKVTSILDNTNKHCDNKNKNNIRLNQKLKESTNYKSEERIENLIQSCNNSLVDSTTFPKIHKPIIVFLHGFGSTAEVFENQLQYFSMMGYSCIAPDLLGHGMSSVPNRKGDYHFDKLLHDLEEVLYHYAFKFGQKCVLIAHNYGCSFATALANKYPHEIHQLVLISGGGPIPLVSPIREGAYHYCLRIILSPLLMCGFRRDILYTIRGRQHPYCGSEQQNRRPFHMKYVLDGMSWPDGDYLFHRRICIPTLLIHGLKDDKVSLVQECQMERTMFKANLEAIPKAGHLPMIDTPNQVNHMIHCFLNLQSKKT